MQIESIRLKNFRAFRDVTMKDIPKLCVLVGANGSGKSTLFSVFAFLRDAMASNVTSALARLGGSRGLQEVRSQSSQVKSPNSSALFLSHVFVGFWSGLARL